VQEAFFPPNIVIPALKLKPLLLPLYLQWLLPHQISNTATPTTNKKHMVEEVMHVVEKQEMGM